MMSLESFIEHNWKEEAAGVGVLVAGGLALKFVPELFVHANAVSDVVEVNAPKIIESGNTTASASKLPLVSDEITFSVHGELSSGVDLNTMFDQMLQDQPLLTDKVAQVIAARARNTEDQVRMADPMILTYRLLDSQAKANAMEVSFSVDGAAVDGTRLDSSGYARSEFKLPIVTAEAVAALSRDLASSDDFWGAITARMEQDQPVLTKTIKVYNTVRATDPKQAELMNQSMAVTYHLLDTQAHLDALKSGLIK